MLLFQLPLEQWQECRDTLQAYSKVVGNVRRALTPRQKHWWHVSLRAAATGLTTTPMPAGDQVVEIRLDFTDHRTYVYSSMSDHRAWSMHGQPVSTYCDQVYAVLTEMGVPADFDRGACEETGELAYDREAVQRVWQAMAQIDGVLKELRHGFRRESSPVQLWPHHFDLAVAWFSGRLVPGQDPDDPDYADEQMSFGFSMGDTGIPEPYFYVTAYPVPEGFVGGPLPEDAYWQTRGFTGAVLPYTALSLADDPKDRLLGFLRAAHQAGASLMGVERP